MRRLNRLLCLLSGLFFNFAVHATETAETASPAESLKEALGVIQTLSADFSRTSKQENRQFLQTGHLWIASPGKFRLETREPAVELLVSDGHTLWTYDEDLEQVIVSDMEEDVSRVPILLFSSDFGAVDAVYRVSEYTDPVRHYYVLEPRSDTSLFRSVSLAFRDSVPDTITIRAANGQSTTVSLTQIEINHPVPPERFEFKAPRDVDIIDERAAADSGDTE